MDTDDAIKRELKKAKDAINAALRALSQRPESWRETKQTYDGTERICPVCKEPILADQKTQRGVHLKCYHYLRNTFVRTGEKTWQQLEKEGWVDPPAKSGRKPIRDLASEAKGTITNRHKQK